MKLFYKILLIALLALIANQTQGEVFASTWAEINPTPSHNFATEQKPGVYILQSDDDGIIIELYAPDYTLQNQHVLGTPCQQIIVPGFAQSGVDGVPQLPQKATILGVPPGVEISLSVESVEMWETPHRIYPCPGPQAVELNDHQDVRRYVEQDRAPDQTIYAQDALYPATTVSLEELGSMRSQRMVRLLFTPFQVNPVTGQLDQYRTLRVRLNFHKACGQVASGQVAGGQVASGQVAGDTGGRSQVAGGQHANMHHAPCNLQPAELQGLTSGSTVGMVYEPSTYEKVMADTLLNYDSALKWRSISENPSIRAASRTHQENNIWLPPENSYRVATQAAGMYAISHSELVAADFPVENIDLQYLHMYHDGQEIAIHITGAEDGRFDEADQIRFYAADYRDKYTRTNIYWLAYEPTYTGSRIAQRASTANAEATAVEHYFATFDYEENVNYLSAIPHESGVEHWYGSRLTVAGPGNAANEEVPLMLEDLPDNLRDVNAVLPDVTVTVDVVGNIEGIHHLQLYVNDSEVYDGSWAGRTYHTAQVDFPARYLREGRNEIRIRLINDLDDRNFDMIYIDRVQLRYPRKLIAQDEPLAFASPEYGAWQYTLAGLAEEAQLYDITNPAFLTQIQAPVSGDILDFSDTQPNIRRYLAVTPEQHLSPSSITAASVDDLINPETGADYIFIAHPDFLDSIEPLVQYREFQGQRVQLVNVQDIYDQFNYGRLSAEAIRDFLAYAYESWPSPAPTYVLLVGDGTYDPIGYLDNSQPTYIPPYLEMVDPTLGETAVDHRYVTVVGDDMLADMHIGRFPAQTPEQVTAMVEKTIRYETQEIEGSWNQQLLFISDNLVGGGGSFYRFSDEVADGYLDPETETTPLIPVGYTKDKIYMGQDCPDGSPATECQQQIMEQLDEGVLLVSYVGHATKDFWAEEQLLNLNALAQLDNKDHLPIMLPMACLEGYFHEAESGIDALSESIVQMADHGAVASWAPTGFGLATGHDYLERGFMEALFHNDITEMGPAADYGKFYLIANGPANKYNDLIDTFMVMGDPALQIRAAGIQPRQRPDPEVEPFNNEQNMLFLPLILR